MDYYRKTTQYQRSYIIQFYLGSIPLRVFEGERSCTLRVKLSKRKFVHVSYG
jgi:hypothetical protein